MDELATDKGHCVYLDSEGVWHGAIKIIIITGNLHKLHENFFTNIIIVLNGTFQDLKPVSSGVPQGTVLGQVLSIIFIND